MKNISTLATKTVQGITNWNIGVVENPIGEFTELNDPDIRWFPSKSDRFIADPFAIDIDGDTHIFVEELPYSSWKGRISYMKYPEDFVTGRIRVAHEEPFHMSYPYLMTFENEIHAIPETHEANEIRLYRLNAPDDWEVRATLVSDVAGTDATVIEYEDRWWMFYTQGKYANSNLYVRYSDDLLGQWKPHDENPVKEDIRSARPGGTPFVNDGELYRPTQYCKGEYGERIVLNHVTELTPTTFSESPVNQIRPRAGSRYPIGRHTLSTHGKITFIDGKRRVRNRHLFRARFQQLIGLLSE